MEGGPSQSKWSAKWVLIEHDWKGLSGLEEGLNAVGRCLGKAGSGPSCGHITSHGDAYGHLWLLVATYYHVGHNVMAKFSYFWALILEFVWIPYIPFRIRLD